MNGVAVGDVIITRNGRAKIVEVHPDTVEARALDTKAKGGKKCLQIRSGEFAVPTTCAILRVLELPGQRWTNVQFIDQASCGIEFLPSGPPDEVRFLFILNHRTYYQKNELRPKPESRFLHLTGWVDRWGHLSHEMELFFKPQESLDTRLFRLKKVHPATRAGILYHLVVDSETFQILWHAFQCELGWVDAPSFPVPQTPK